MARAGGFWGGPAGLICFDACKDGRQHGDILVVLMLIRPNWEYTGGLGLISNNADKAYLNGDGRRIYDWIEQAENDNSRPNHRHFTTGTHEKLHGFMTDGSRLDIEHWVGKRSRIVSNDA